MEVVGFLQEMLHNVAEYAVSFRLGQSILRQVDRVLWTIEKCARWAVPPPLDQDEHPQPELIRPLPWVFFLTMLVVLRVIRESISLINLLLGKPPLRSADVVTYIQSKRRYLRTLKYQGNRIMRARATPAQPTQTWFSSVQSLFEFTMCFRRHTQNYGNNNTTRISNNDEVLVVKRNKRGIHEVSPVASISETSMERLIEKMMVDLQADSDDDSSYTLTNPMSAKSDQSGDDADSEQEPIVENVISNQSTTQFINSCQTDILKPKNYKDQLSHDVSEYGNSPTTDIKFQNKENMRIEGLEVTSKNETKLLLQSERNFTQNYRPHNQAKLKPDMANGKAVRSADSKDKEVSIIPSQETA